MKAYLSSALCLLLLFLGGALHSLPADSSIGGQDVSALKSYADAFNRSRNYNSSSGPAESYCLSSGTFLTYHPCQDMPTCRETANLVCSTSGNGACDIELLATHILYYKNGVDRLNAADTRFRVALSRFSASPSLSDIDEMGAAFNDMRAAGDAVGQSKLRYPERISCACASDPYQCCLGRCPEARFDYAALASGQSKLSELRSKPCSDGTPANSCSATKPLRCVGWRLVEDRARCGCPAGQLIVDGRCACPSGQVMQGDGQCGCPAGQAMSDGVCVATCADGTREGQCASAPPLRCVGGQLLNDSSVCGCPAGHVVEGNTCACPVETSEVCRLTNVTKYRDVTYLFDRNYTRVVSEPFTYIKRSCYPEVSRYGGPSCADLAERVVGSTPSSESPEPPQVNEKRVACDRCPAVCDRLPPNGLQCGACLCPPNLGFCDAEGARGVANSTPSYCAQELLRPQKKDLMVCAQGFECRTGVCREGECYDPEFVPSILNWLRKLLHLAP